MRNSGRISATGLGSQLKRATDESLLVMVFELIKDSME